MDIDCLKGGWRSDERGVTTAEVVRVRFQRTWCECVARYEKWRERLWVAVCSMLRFADARVSSFCHGDRKVEISSSEWNKWFDYLKLTTKSEYEWLLRLHAVSMVQLPARVCASAGLIPPWSFWSYKRYSPENPRIPSKDEVQENGVQVPRTHPKHKHERHTWHDFLHRMHSYIFSILISSFFSVFFLHVFFFCERVFVFLPFWKDIEVVLKPASDSCGTEFSSFSGKIGEWCIVSLTPFFWLVLVYCKWQGLMLRVGCLVAKIHWWRKIKCTLLTWNYGFLVWCASFLPDCIFCNWWFFSELSEKKNIDKVLSGART